MKKIILILFMLSVCYVSFAQNDTLVTKKSNDKVLIGGQVYYVHIVKKGDSLYSLSKVYNVSQKDIAKENPEIFLGLKIGQALKIPYISDNGTEDKEVKNKKDFIYHRVKKGQTLYSLSRKYNVSQEDIITCNPTIRYGVNENQIVKIPRSKDVVESIQKFPISESLKDTVKLYDQFIYHTVVQGETKYSLARSYEITEALLLEYNPVLNEGMKTGQILKIPKIVNKETVSIMFKSDTITSDSLPEGRNLIAYSDTLNYIECEKIQDDSGKIYQIALILPFYLEKNDEEFYIDSTEYNSFGKKIYEKVYYDPYYIYPKSLNFVEFYEGFLLAADSLKRQGLSFNLHVYDSRNDTTRVKEILGFPELASMDLIFGPVYSQEIQLVSEFSKEHGIKMVSPLYDNLKLVDNNEYLFQVYPSYNAQIEAFSKFVSTFEDKNIIMVHNGDSLQDANMQMVKSKIFANLSKDTLVNNIQFKEVILKDSINVLSHALSKELENIFIIPSNDEAFVTDIITKLYTLKTYGNNIKAVGLARWQRFKNIDPEYYFNLELNIATPFFIDYRDRDVKNFVLKYRDTYKTEPEGIAIHAYDVGLFFLTALANYGSNFENCLRSNKVDLLQADYRFVKWSEGSGFENVGVDIVKYGNGYSIFRNDYKKKNTEHFTYNLK